MIALSLEENRRLKVNLKTVSGGGGDNIFMRALSPYLKK